MGKISDLIKILKGEGRIAGARRAERIGDEAPYAAERISEDTLRRALSGGDNADTLALISPEDFRYLAAPFDSGYMNLARTPKMYAPSDMSVKDYIKYLGKVSQEQGFDDIPFLMYNQHEGTNKLGVTGHEGRHRMRALENLDDEKALVRLLPRAAVREPLPRNTREEFLQALGEKYGVPLRLDPEDVESVSVDLTKPVQPFQVGGLARFFSAVDEAVANLRQKKGTGEQMLKQIQQSPGVKKEELELRRLPEKLAGQQKVTQEDIQAMLKAVPAPKLQMTMRADKPQKLTPPELEKWIGDSEERRTAVKLLDSHGYEPVQNPDDPGMLGFLSPDGDIIDKMDMDYILETDLEVTNAALQDATYRYYSMLDSNNIRRPEFDKDTFNAAAKEYQQARDNFKKLQEDTNAFRRFVEEWEDTTLSYKTPKFEQYQTPGPSSNYRELLIQLAPEERKVVERPPFEYGRQGLGGDPEILTPEEGARRIGLPDIEDLGGQDVESVLYYPSGMFISKGKDGSYITFGGTDEIVTKDLAEAEEWLSRQMEAELRPPMYEPSTTRPYVKEVHFPEPDIVVHTRVSDRVGPNGEKILYVDEIQSDWHQDARKVRQQKAEDIVKYGPVADELAEEARRQVKIDLGLDPNAEIPSFLAETPEKVHERFKNKVAQLQKERMAEEMKKLPKDYGYKKLGTRTAPWSQSSHELAVKQILDTAANEGYDKVVFAPGSEQVRRYSLGTYANSMEVRRQGDDFMVVADLKEGGRRTFDNLSKDKLAELIGEDRAAKALADLDAGESGSRFTEKDLMLGGKQARGKIAIYDEIIPQYLSKYAGKEFNVQPGRTPIVAEDLDELKTSWEYEKRAALQKDLQKQFDEGSLDEETANELRNVLEEYKINEVRKEIFSPSWGDSPYMRFVEKFATVDNANGMNNIDYLVESLDPISFGRGTGYIANIEPQRVRFKDPEKQAAYEQFLEDEWLNYDISDYTARDVLYPYFKDIADERIMNMAPEELFAGMPNPKTVEGASIDITPEMREKIKTRGQPLFAVPPALGIGAAVSEDEEEEQPVQEFKEAGKVEKKKGLDKPEFDSPFVESKRIGPKVGVSAGPAKIRDLTKILRGENAEQQNLSRQRIAGNVEAGKGLGEYMYEMMVPQTGAEWALEAAFFPVPRPVRKGLLAAAGAMYDPEAEAGKISFLHGSPSKIKTLEAGKDLWGTTDPEYALKRAMDKMRLAEGAQGPGYLNRFEIEETDLMRLADKYSPEDIAIARKAFSRLPEGQEMTGEQIYELASGNTGGAKKAALEGVTKALGKKGYQVPSGADDKGEWYRVLEQTDLEIQRYTGGRIKKSR